MLFSSKVPSGYLKLFWVILTPESEWLGATGPKPFFYFKWRSPWWSRSGTIVRCCPHQGFKNRHFCTVFRNNNNWATLAIWVFSILLPSSHLGIFPYKTITFWIICTILLTYSEPKYAFPYATLFLPCKLNYPTSIIRSWWKLTFITTHIILSKSTYSPIPFLYIQFSYSSTHLRS